MRRPRFLLPLLVFAWWTGEGLAWAARDVIVRDAAGDPTGWMEILRPALLLAWLWVPLTLALFWLVRRHPLEPGRILRSLTVLTLAVFAVLGVRIAVIAAGNDIVGWYETLPPLAHMLATGFSYNLFLAWMIIGVAHALLFAERSRQRERQATELEASLAQARLETLSAQLNPHFLFNALNSIAEQVHRDPDAADRMLVGLGALLRRNLDGAAQQVPLSDELELLSQYLDIEKMRLGDRLHVDWDIEPDTLDCGVPQLVLQPLAENAIRHALSRRTTPGLLVVRAFRSDSRLVLEVQDDGGPEAPVATGNGVGLSTTRARLRCTYGDDHDLDIRRREGGGTLVRIDMPAAHAARTR